MYVLFIPIDMIKLFRRNKTSDYSDVELVVGLKKDDKAVEEACYQKCKTYFYANYRAVFFTGENEIDDLFHETYLTFWDNLKKGKIYVEDGEMKGKNGKPFRSSLTTFLMGIAKLKNLEWVRQNQLHNKDKNDDKEIWDSFMSTDENDESEFMLNYISECLSKMANRCRQIITMFYHEMKPLDEILDELTSFKSKNALKTAKYKCMENLKQCSNDMYEHYLNS